MCYRAAEKLPLWGAVPVAGLAASVPPALFLAVIMLLF